MSKNIQAWYVGKTNKPFVDFGSIREGEAELHTFSSKHSEANIRMLKLTSVFHHLPRVGPKQLCALAHLKSTHEAGTF